jgi:biopolymer transport protein ExbB/TolQ
VNTATLASLPLPAYFCNPLRLSGLQCGIEYWQHLDWIRRLDLSLLAVMLFSVIILFCLGTYRYHLASYQLRIFVRDAAGMLRRGAFDELMAVASRTSASPYAGVVECALKEFGSASPDLSKEEAIDLARRGFEPAERANLTYISLGRGWLRSIVVTAPFLGLAGTILGILDLFAGAGMQRQAFLAMVTWKLSTALVTTAAGLLVAGPAVWTYTYLQVRTEKLEYEMSNAALELIDGLSALPEYQSRQGISEREFIDLRSRGRGKFLLKVRFAELPSFGLLGSTFLAAGMMVFLAFPSFYRPIGLGVLLSPPMPRGAPGASAKPLVIELRSGSGGPLVILVDSKETPWEKLDSRVANGLKLRRQSIAYVRAQSDIPWTSVASVIDVVRGVADHVVLMTGPRIQGYP